MGGREALSTIHVVFTDHALARDHFIIALDADALPMVVITADSSRLFDTLLLAYKHLEWVEIFLSEALLE